MRFYHTFGCQIYFGDPIVDSVINSVWTESGSIYPTIFFGRYCSISNSRIGDIAANGGSLTLPATVVFRNSSISNTTIGSICSSGSGTSYVIDQARLEPLVLSQRLACTPPYHPKGSLFHLTRRGPFSGSRSVSLTLRD